MIKDGGVEVTKEVALDGYIFEISVTRHPGGWVECAARTKPILSKNPYNTFPKLLLQERDWISND